MSFDEFYGLLMSFDVLFYTWCVSQMYNVVCVPDVNRNRQTPSPFPSNQNENLTLTLFIVCTNS